MALIEAYFDESEDDSTTYLCVAGYLFDPDNCRQLDGKWAATLKSFKDLPYFRMSSCAHNQPPFDRLTRDECIECEKEMIGHITTHATHGLFVSTKINEFQRALGSLDPFGDAYSWACFMCMLGASKWAERNNFAGDIAYFFEAGHRHAKRAHALLDEISKIESMKKDFRYAAHTFVDKAKVRPVQTADILAWQGATHHKRVARGITKPRADFRALLECKATAFHADEKMFESFRVEYMEKLSPEMQSALLTRR